MLLLNKEFSMFIQMTIQSKASNDFRAFLACTDSNGIEWEIRGYGKTPVEASENAWKKYSEDEGFWHIYGYTVFHEQVEA
jgi:hypothetical protein